jgi:dTDP-4-dehydrorhamnose 3,5-epimerase-like enzyme
MFYVEKGNVLAAFEHIKTKEKKVTTMTAGRHIVHVPNYVALSTKNIGKTKAVLVFFSNLALREEEDSFPYTVL